MKTLNEKLKNYSLLTAALGATPAIAQMVYTDVNPDQTISTFGAGLNVDIDNNGTPEFSMIAYSSISISYSIKGIYLSGSNGQVNYSYTSFSIGTSSTSLSTPVAMNLNDPIYGALNFGSGWMSVQGVYGGSSFQVGAWSGQTDKYLGVQFTIGTSTHYGWVRMDVGTDGKTFTLKDYAYNATAATTVLAGDMGVSAINEFSPPGLGSACTGNGTDKTSDATSTGTLTEAGMKTVIAECFDNGGTPDTILVGSSNKQVISGLSQSVSELRTATDKVSPASVVAAVDVYVSDFGTFKIIPDRFQRARDMWFIDFDFWAVAYLRPFRTETLAKTGDSVKQMLVAEYGLMSKNQKSSGFLADV